MNQEEFDKIYFSKKSTDQLLERVFKPEKYKEFHEYLNKLHEEWLGYWRKK